MARYIIKRLLLLIPIIIGVSFVVFFTLDLAPGDPVYQIVSERASDEEIEAAREAYGLNKPFIVRYGKYLFNLLHGDMGTSYRSKESVFKLYMQKIPATLTLAAAAVLVALFISLPLGIISAMNQNTWKDALGMLLSLLGQSIPNFWLGLMLIILFVLKLKLFPSGGFEHGLRSLVLPALTEGTGLAAIMARTTRSAMLETIRQDYIVTARAKGVSRKMSVRKHALKNALIPITTAAGMQFAHVMGGCVLTETVFAWPGVGRQIIVAIGDLDTPIVTGFLIMTCIVTCIVNLFLDIIYAYVDPRVKAQYTSMGQIQRKKQEREIREASNGTK